MGDGVAIKSEGRAGLLGWVGRHGIGPVWLETWKFIAPLNPNKVVPIDFHIFAALETLLVASSLLSYTSL